MEIHSDIAKRVIMKEANALVELSSNLPPDFNRIVDYILKLNGRLIFTGMGKSGYIAHKIASSFAMTGTPACYLHAAEASHGDLGMITKDDFVIMLSKSGETKELFDIIKYCKKFSIKTVLMTMNANSSVAVISDFLLTIPQTKEVSNIDVPTTSAILMLSLGDALVTAVHEAKGFSSDDFYLYHPGGKIGSTLAKVENLMRKHDQIPLVHADTSFGDTILVMNRKGLGCAIVLDERNRLIGIITDEDLRKHMNERMTTKYAKDVMSNIHCISGSILAAEALALMNEMKLTSLPVVENETVLGIIHLYDILSAGIA